ncbi:5-oxoprolinase subunit PxpB [Algibacter sp. 2305UL17-15]|uniref:5-oxoprolinase subunit PxpB n=1 Tax=Algibacter sp. 2305UL17-15 TaxID=3231268 RepID=UPI003459F450
MKFQLKYQPFGERSILIVWPAKIDTTILNDVLNFKHKIEIELTSKFISINNAYNSILITYSIEPLVLDEEIERLKSLYNSLGKIEKRTSRLWKLPVCYDASFGMDLKGMSQEKNLSVETIIKRHSQPKYTIYFIGFLPGFLYLGGLDKTLFTPRKATPRLKIEKGAVGIGGEQTGVYPSASPGGWNIIGNSPIDFFNVLQNPPCFAKAGDVIQFYPISLEEHENIKTLVEAGVYQIESEVVND